MFFATTREEPGSTTSRKAWPCLVFFGPADGPRDRASAAALSGPGRTPARSVAVLAGGLAGERPPPRGQAVVEEARPAAEETGKIIRASRSTWSAASSALMTLALESTGCRRRRSP